MAEKLQLPHYSPGENYHRSTFKSFPLTPVETPTLENAAINDTFRLGVNTSSLLLGHVADSEDALNNSQIGVKADLQNKKFTITLERGDYVMRFFGNVMQIHDFDDITLTLFLRESRPITRMRQ